MIPCQSRVPGIRAGHFGGAIRNSATTNWLLSRPCSCPSLPQGFAECHWYLPQGLLSSGLMPHCVPPLNWGLPASRWAWFVPYLPLHEAKVLSPWRVRRAVGGAQALGLMGLGSSPRFTNRVNLAKPFLFYLFLILCNESDSTVAQGCVRFRSRAPAPCLDCAQHTLSVT